MPLSTPLKATLVTLSLAPVVAPALYLLVVQALTARVVASSTTHTRVLSAKDKDRLGGADAVSSAAVSPADAAPPRSLPDALFDDSASYVLSCTRVVSKPVPIAAAPSPDTTSTPTSTPTPAATPSLLTAYMRGSMAAFAATPQGRILRSLVDPDTALRHTFDADYLASLAFTTADLVCGAYVVTYRAAAPEASAVAAAHASTNVDRAELAVVPLAARPGLVVHAIVVSAVERTAAAQAVFVSETWMWRHAEHERPTLLETALGRWVYGMLSGWLVLKGVKAVAAV